MIGLAGWLENKNGATGAVFCSAGVRVRVIIRDLLACKYSPRKNTAGVRIKVLQQRKKQPDGYILYYG